MSGHVPRGRAAEENRIHDANVSGGGRSDNDTNSSSNSSRNSSTATASFTASPPPIPPTSRALLDSTGTPAKRSDGDVRPARATASTATPSTPAPTAISSTPIPSDTVPPVLEPITAAPASPDAPSSSDPSTTHPASHPFAERFLPSHVDASHVISSAAPTSLPIELPAIRAENVPTPPASSPTSESLPSSATTPPSYTPGNPTSAYAANLHLLTPFQRWTLRASESQFNALAGAVGGFTSGVFTCPLDVIKTKLQAQGGFAAMHRQATATGAAAAAAGQSHHRLYNGLVGTARVIWRDEGVRGLYRGLGPIIMGYLPTWAVWFTVYNKSKSVMSERYHIENTFVINFWSSVVAGASSTIVTNPIWVIKTRLMSQMPRGPPGTVAPATGGTPTSRPTISTPWHYRSTLDAARKMYTTEGVLSFYSGLTPALLGLTHVAVQFPAYEYFKTQFTGRGMGESPSEGEAPAHWLGILSATILSKVLASSLTYPHEVIRTRLQTQRRQATKAAAQTGGGAAGAQDAPRYRGIVTTFRTILQEEGWRAFYAGMGTNMMRAVPAATVTMLTYEYVMRSLKRTRQDARHTVEGR
ncbi:solute carrier family 25 (mitochondrial folate transporter), member 32 [Sporothrix schenckii 1099-18]|uniref:Solute carrier family 25 (Mitochondrial folate transporter), member 32 n=1 Tax=Sporothrix schenckii 1099-18 TaxID=1397361 RepID=A0A0F2MJD4_SPOSC|nr:solute carrier family 25 (mitochondrial folate transporter), member 32 [Sporothrix schenckii 1099-18]KJR89174.1 solute carrier family 25 (mitochondrial folate transporter), member 32 [Sporothrix schenckii 1099-18]